MFQAMFNSLSGLFSFSRSLNTVSNNVSNMNTPGFRGSDSFFENVNGGRGVMIGGEGLRTAAGDLRQTGNATDLAIDGSGYFVLRDPLTQALHYTRAGQFRFDAQGVLTDTATGFEVMAFAADGTLASIDFDAYRTRAPAPTTRVNIRGQFSAGSPSVSNVNVFDRLGTAHSLTISLVATDTDTPPGPAGQYRVMVNDGTTTTAAGLIQFDPLTGMLGSTQNSVSATLNFNGVPQAVTLDFGVQAGGVMRLPGGSGQLTANVVDGNGMLGFTDMSFDANGIMQIRYSGTIREAGPQLALAHFANEADLELVGGRLISGVSVHERILGRAGQGVFGRIAGGSLEMANVDLTTEFADMIIIQRGYQASSRVMSVSNEMIEQLYNSTRGG